MVRNICIMLSVCLMVTFRGCTSDQGRSELSVITSDQKIETADVFKPIRAMDVITDLEELDVFKKLEVMDVFSVLQVMDIPIGKDVGKNGRLLSDGTEWLYNRKAVIYASDKLCGVRGLDVDKEIEEEMEKAASGAAVSGTTTDSTQEVIPIEKWDTIGNKVTRRLSSSVSKEANKRNQKITSTYNPYDKVAGHMISNVIADSETTFSDVNLLRSGNVVKITVDFTQTLYFAKDFPIPEKYRTQLDKDAEEITKTAVDATSGAAVTTGASVTSGSAVASDGTNITLPTEKMEFYFQLTTGEELSKEQVESGIGDIVPDGMNIRIKAGDGSSAVCTVTGMKDKDIQEGINKIIKDTSEQFSENCIQKDMEGKLEIVEHENAVDYLQKRYTATGYSKDGKKLLKTNISIYVRINKNQKNFQYLTSEQSSKRTVLSILCRYILRKSTYIKAETKYYVKKEDLDKKLDKVEFPKESGISDLMLIDIKKQNKTRVDEVILRHVEKKVEESKKKEEQTKPAGSEEPIKSSEPVATPKTTALPTPAATEGSRKNESKMVSAVVASLGKGFVLDHYRTKKSYTRTKNYTEEKAVKKEIEEEGIVYVKPTEKPIEKTLEVELPGKKVERYYTINVNLMTGKKIMLGDSFPKAGVLSNALKNSTNLQCFTMEEYKNEMEIPDAVNLQALKKVEIPKALKTVARPYKIEEDEEAPTETIEPVSVASKAKMGITSLENRVLEWYFSSRPDDYANEFSYQDTYKTPCSLFLGSDTKKDGAFALFMDINLYGEDTQIVLQLPYSDYQ